MSAADLIDLPDDGQRTELVRGHLVREPPAGGEHGWLGVNLASALRDFVRSHGEGFVFGADTGFILSRDPDTVRAPVAAWVAASRMPEGPPPGFIPFAPDLAAEIMSPSDRMINPIRKVFDHLDAGTRLVWLIDPANRTAHVYRAGGDVVVLRDSDPLDGYDILPGFLLPLAVLFAG